MSNTIYQPVKKAAVTGLAAAFLATALLPVATAEAGHKTHWKHHHAPKVVYVKKYKKHRRYDGGDALAAGIVGLAVGAIIADQTIRYRQPNVVYVQPQPRYVAPQPVYVAPQPVYPSHSTPRVITYENSVGVSYEPWSPEWYDWCRANYRSFNASKGTYRGYDGLDHFCVVK